MLWRLPSLPPRWRLLALALPLRYLRASFFFLPPGFGLAVPPGLVLGCYPWLPLPLETVFWFSGGCRRVWFLVAVGLFGVVVLKNWARPVLVCP